MTHSLKNFDTASSGVSNLPEFVSVWFVDEVQVARCDSNSKKAEPKQDWMIRVSEDDPQYWESQTQICVANQPLSQAIIESFKQRFNQTYDCLRNFLIFEIFMTSKFFKKYKVDKTLKVFEKIFVMEICQLLTKSISEQGFQFDEKLLRVESRQPDAKFGK